MSRYVLITVKGKYYTQPYSSGYSSAINKAGTTSNLNDAYLFNQQEIYKYKNFLEHVVEVEAIEHRTVELVKISDHYVKPYNEDEASRLKRIERDENNEVSDE